MKICVFGLGYVGCVTAAYLSRLGHEVVGVDVQQEKVDHINEGVAPILESGLNELISQAWAEGRLRATTDVASAFRDADVSYVCVGTPSLVSGRLNLDYVRHVCGQIAVALKSGADGKCHQLILRSTMLPGSTRELVEEFFAELSAQGRVEVTYAPEFLREGSAVSDCQQPALTVLGTEGGAEVAEAVKALFPFEGREVVTWEAAEMTKYACNFFHALKTGFANEIGRLSKCVGVDGLRVMEILCKDDKLNISRAYLRPGNPFGGSCLPKDVRALASLARVKGESLPLLEDVLTSNEAHLDALLRLVIKYQIKSVGIIGLTFKEGTDDLRESPMVALAENLLAKGCRLRIYDAQLELSQLKGANKLEIGRRIPALSRLLEASASTVFQQCDLIVVAQRCFSPAGIGGPLDAEKIIIDVNGWPELKELGCRYEGFCW